MVGAWSPSCLWKGWLGTGENVSFGLHLLLLPQEVPKAFVRWDIENVPGDEGSEAPTPCYTSCLGLGCLRSVLGLCLPKPEEPFGASFQGRG